MTAALNLDHDRLLKMVNERLALDVFQVKRAAFNPEGRFDSTGLFDLYLRHQGRFMAVGHTQFVLPVFTLEESGERVRLYFHYLQSKTELHIIIRLIGADGMPVPAKQ